MPDKLADLGALRFLAPERVLAALRLVRRGQVYDLGVELGAHMFNPSPECVAPFSYRRTFSQGPDDVGIRFCGEIAEGDIHHGTHIDSLVHYQRDGRVYGGREAKSLQVDAGWTAFGAETIPPIVCRGVVIDVAHGRVDAVPDGYVVEQEEMAAAVSAQGIELKAGDAVLIRTGKITQFVADAFSPSPEAPGISRQAAEWLAQQGMMLCGIDTPSPDSGPFRDWNDLVHEELLMRRGIHIIENLYLEDLALIDEREFAFVCSPLKIHGATGAWVRPIAIA